MSAFLISMVLLCGIGVGIWFVVRGEVQTPVPPHLPEDVRCLPGPKGLPYLGCVHKLDSENPWMSFHKWAVTYGPIYQVTLGGHNHVWISDEGVAHDLLAKRGAIYSDRPHIPALLHDNRDSAEYLPLMSMNYAWRRQRAFGKAIMDRCHVDKYYGFPELEAKRMMKEILDDPTKYNTSMESFTARVTSRLAWGTSEASDELKQRARELLIGVSPTGAMGNKLPFLMSLPDLFSPPRAWERRRMRTERAFFMTMQEEVSNKVAAGKAIPSWTQSFLSSPSAHNFSGYVEGAYAVGIHSIAGALTIAAPMQSFCLAMCLYPRFLPKLQAEIDGVCDLSRPPTNDDMPRLPYLRACIRETLRWRPPVPTGIPHNSAQDDVYNGYFIPKDSVIHPLEWTMARNPAKYPFPEAFNPDRWVDPAYPTYQEPLTKYPTITQSSQFGFGRRICQGQGVTEADLFVGVGALAWAFDIRRALDKETGLEVKVPECAFSELLIAKPKWFEFELRPRSEERMARIEALYEEEKSNGEFVPAREYWDEKTTPGLGWGKV